MIEKSNIMKKFHDSRRLHFEANTGLSFETQCIKIRNNVWEYNLILNQSKNENENK